MSQAANTRALRDLTGLSQSDAAKMFNVHINSYKRWESPNFAQVAPPFIKNRYKSILVGREQLVQFVLNNEDYNLDGAQKITFTYYRDQAEFDRYGRDKGSFHLANANTLESVRVLLRAGKSIEDIEFCYPTEKGNLHKKAKEK